MFNEYILTEGLHPSEIIIFLIFVWAAYMFISIRKDLTKTSLFREDYYIFWIDAVVFLCLQQFFDMLDNLPHLRFFNYLEHAAFLIGVSFFTYAIYKSFLKYKQASEESKK